MKKTPIQILRDLVDVHSVATELVDDNRFEELAAEYISHDAPTMPELREKVMDQAKRVLEDAEPNLAPRWEDAPTGPVGWRRTTTPSGTGTRASQRKAPMAGVGSHPAVTARCAPKSLPARRPTASGAIHCRFARRHRRTFEPYPLVSSNKKAAPKEVRLLSSQQAIKDSALPEP